jgi:hypothetical protein
MNIGSITTSTTVQSSELNKVNKKTNANANSTQEQTSSRRSDILDISAEAMSYQPIQSRIASGFYDKPEIVQEVAQRLSNDL